MPRSKSPIPEEMLSVRARLAEWRKGHRRRSRLPEELWAAAVELAHRHGLYRTAQALPIDYAGLRSRVQARAAESRSTTAAVARPPEFVEVRLSPPVPISPGYCCAYRSPAPWTGLNSCAPGGKASAEMIQITPQMRVLVAVEPVDLRKGIDGLAALCREKLQADPFSGWLFVFRSRRAKAIRVLVYDGQGFWLAHKRLSQGRFPWWPARGIGFSNCSRMKVTKPPGVANSPMYPFRYSRSRHFHFQSHMAIEEFRDACHDRDFTESPPDLRWSV